MMILTGKYFRKNIVHIQSGIKQTQETALH